MKKNILIFIYLFCISFLLEAQNKIKLFFNGDWKVTNKENAFYIREAEYDLQDFTLNGKVSDFDINGNPVMEGNYLHGKKNGMFIFYYRNGIIESQGSYIDNKRDGRWTYRYPNNQVKQSITFLNCNEKEPFIVNDYYDNRGKPLVKNGTGKWTNDSISQSEAGSRVTLIKVTGKFKNSLKTGQWKKIQISNRRVLTVEKFRKGKLIAYKSGFLKSYYKLPDIPSRMNERLQQEMRSGISHEELIGDASIRKIDDLPWIKGKEDVINKANSVLAPGSVTTLPEGLGTKYDIKQNIIIDKYDGKINKLARIKNAVETIEKMPDSYYLKLKILKC